MNGEKLREENKPADRDHTSSIPDRRVAPAGVVPKQAQGYLMAGLAILILLAVMFSRNHAKIQEKSNSPQPLVASSDVNQRKIQELEQDLTAEQHQANIERAKRETSVRDEEVQGSARLDSSPIAVPTAAPAPAPNEPVHDPILDAEKSLLFKARFASNLVGEAGSAMKEATVRATSEGQSAGAPLGEPGDAKLEGPPEPLPASPNSKRDAEVNVNVAHGNPYVVFEGSVIDAVLLNRLAGDFVGPIKVMVTNPVFSQNRQHVLIPEGTFLLGEAQKVSGFGQRRLSVSFHRLIMPDGYSADLDQFHGLDQAGDVGLKDRVNNHYLATFGVSIALGLISGAAEASSGAGINETGSDLYRQGMASSLAQSGTNVLDRFLNVLPTITIREGHRVKVYITQDMLLPAYENHAIRGDI